MIAKYGHLVKSRKLFSLPQLDPDDHTHSCVVRYSDNSRRADLLLRLLVLPNLVDIFLDLHNQKTNDVFDILSTLQGLRRLTLSISRMSQLDLARLSSLTSLVSFVFRG
jgi:hypothetical protein